MFYNTCKGNDFSLKSKENSVKRHFPSIKLIKYQVINIGSIFQAVKRDELNNDRTNSYLSLGQA